MKAYVFVVCGEDKHIETLHFSMKYLKLFSEQIIYVVTDSTRNKTPISHSNIIDVKTPVNLDHHQASIWLKTSLHRILPQENTYCYLDSDVIAVNSNCDNIFSCFKSPISFAPDHCKIKEFSPYAINCGCLNNYISDKNNFENAISSIIKNKHYPPNFHDINIRKIFTFLEIIRNQPLKNFGVICRMILSLLGFNLKLNNKYILSKKEKGFKLINEDFIYPFIYFHKDEIKAKLNYRFDYIRLKWLKPDGTKFAKNSCNHLKENIKENFGIELNNPHWQHWNGGVFLFDNSSHEFLETWHQFTLNIFNNPKWKTRDQGTLIATAWKYGLFDHPTIPEEFNFIADYYKFDLSINNNSNSLEIKKNNKLIYPNFVHVYHEFGNKNWNLWQAIEKLKNGVN